MRPAVTARHGLVLAGIVSLGTVFTAFVLFETPGLGIGHFYYFAIATIALATGPVLGAAAGVAAAGLYMTGVLLNPAIPVHEALTTGSGIRLVCYTGMGLLIGFFAQRNRELVERLRIMAERDFLTGLPNTRAFEAAIARRLESGRPFGLLLGDMDGLKTINDSRGHAEGNEVLRRLAAVLGNSLRAEDEVARVGGDEFAVLSSLRTGDEAAQLAARLEAIMRANGASITFGWSVSGQDGTEALTLFRAADERLYARKFVRSKDVRRVKLAPVAGAS